MRDKELDLATKEGKFASIISLTMKFPIDGLHIDSNSEAPFCVLFRYFFPQQGGKEKFLSSQTCLVNLLHN
jgi:hypothetical protein